MKKILIAGGAGYIGSHIAHDLIEQGNDVTIFDNFSTGFHENIHPKSKMIEGDLQNFVEINDVLHNEKFDVVFHFAASKAAGESMTDPFKFVNNNLFGTLNLLEAMVNNDVKNFIFSSSAAVYGEPQYLPADEKHPTEPANYYGYTKLAIERNLKWFSELKGLRYAALRYFNATGYDIAGRISMMEKDAANLSPLIMETIYGKREQLLVFGDDYETEDGTCLRDYIHVNDLATAHIKAMDYITSKNEDLIVNLGTGEAFSVFDMIKAAEKVTKKKVNYKIVDRREGDPVQLVADASKAEKLLEWKAEFSSLEQIFSSMIPVYDK